MNLAMDAALSLGYRSRAQITRVVTEEWAAQQLFCPACDSARLTRATANTKAIDLSCDGCHATYQLKSGSRWSEKRVPDAAYDSMMAAIRSDRVPNLLVMQYSPNWTVRNLLLVPSFFFHHSAIERRKPLGPAARRAGWIGCNILLAAIPPEGKLQIIKDGVPLEPATIRKQYRRMRSLSAFRPEGRGWTVHVLNLIHRLDSKEFHLAELYEFETALAKDFPKNRNIRPKIRQQLQRLRDMGVICFLGRGWYRVINRD